MPSIDRTAIAPLLLPHFPEMDKATSDDWHAFLNEATGLDIAIDEPNGGAFDKWRQALAAKGYGGVWSHTPAQIEAMKVRGRQLIKNHEEARAAEAKRGFPETENILRIRAAEAEKAAKGKP